MCIFQGLVVRGIGVEVLKGLIIVAVSSCGRWILGVVLIFVVPSLIVMVIVVVISPIISFMLVVVLIVDRIATSLTAKTTVLGMVMSSASYALVVLTGLDPR